MLFSRYRTDVLPDFRPPQLAGEPFESGSFRARKTGWPRLQRLRFVDVWHWLGSEILHLNIATEPWHKAVFALLQIATVDIHESTHVQLMVQALEALSVKKREKIQATLLQILGEALANPRAAEEWLTEVYELRSCVAHGALPIPRPGTYVDYEDDPQYGELTKKYWAPFDTTTSVLVAVLQYLIRNNEKTLRHDISV